MNTYLLLKTLHIISFTAWFAGLFYMPRLFVYHVEHPQAAPTLTLMETKLKNLILRPAAAATVLFGMALIAQNPAIMQQGWLHAKLALVVILLAFHGSLEVFARHLRQGTNTRTGRFYRFYNEIPTLLLIGIVGLAVIKPF
ncbi:MAG: protoporphyrinogen oxidase HemJ [Alphaproteobacteria bacterium]